MNNNLHGRKSNTGSGFDANAWRNAHVVEAETKDSLVNMVLYTLIGVASLGVFILFITNFLRAKQAEKELQIFENNKAMAIAQANAPQKPAAQKSMTGLDAIDAEIDKFQDITQVLHLCGKNYSHISDTYYKQNKTVYAQLYKMRNAAWRANYNSVQTSDLSKSINRINKIENGADVAKFMITGGAAKHMRASMGFMADMKKLNQEMQAKKKADAERRAQANDPAYCTKFASKVQLGQMNIKLPK